jgi:uncharacterized Zn finger protein (UPF0148 family)
MGDVLNFKCPCCGAKLTFSGKTEEMTCEYCDASFSIEQAKAAQEQKAAKTETHHERKSVKAQIAEKKDIIAKTAAEKAAPVKITIRRFKGLSSGPAEHIPVPVNSWEE